VNACLIQAEPTTQTRRVIGLAFHGEGGPLERDWRDNADALLAKRILELAKAGERDPNTLCDATLESFRPRRAIE
jgi:hypothetical protein